MKSILMRMGSLFEDEGWLPEGAEVIDLQQLEGTTCYLDAEAEAAIVRAIGSCPLRALHWIDGGDYHYLSELWMRKLEKPARLFLFDNHPDDQKPAFGGDILSCGGWVAHASRTNPLIDPDAEDAYISIDLDLLSEEYARTNWNQGSTTLPELLAALERIRAAHPIAGVDICGGITLAQGGTPSDFAVNLRTRQVLLDYFREV